MIKIKIKRAIYLTLSGSVFFSMLFYSIYLANSSSTPLSMWAHIAFTALGLVIFALTSFLMVLINMIVTRDGNINILFPVGILFYTFLGKHKYVYHTELGYFITEVSYSSITVFKQNIFNMIEIFTIPINEHSTIDQIQSSIKNGLDNHYHAELAKVEEANKKKSTVNKVMCWDGYLDVQGKRDDKLNDIL